MVQIYEEVFKIKRIILHYDMDSFFASIEIRDNPKLKNKPVAVGQSIVTTASYEARKFGIHSAMSVFEAKKLCPHLIVVPTDKEKYHRVSNFIHSLVFKITKKIEFISLDEGYIDISDIGLSKEKLKKFAETFRKRIKYHTKLTCSIGIGFNKLSAKIASDINKPNGQFIFYNEEEFIDFIKEKELKIIPGIGKKYRELLKKKNIHFVKDAFPYSLKELTSAYGKSRGELLYLSIRGIDYSEVDYKQEIFSIGNENTYRYPIVSEPNIKKEIMDIFAYSYKRLVRKELMAKTVHIKIKFVNNKTLTRSKTLFSPSDNEEKLYENIESLIDSLTLKTPVKLLGVSFSNLIKKSVRQLSFF